MSTETTMMKHQPPSFAFTIKPLLLAVAAFYIVTGCVPYHPSGGILIHGENTQVDIVFSDHDITLIREHYRQHLPPGLAKKKQLPPGLQKKVDRTGQLPPGLQREPLPPALEVRLSPLPNGYVRVRVGIDVVLMNQRTRVVVDIIQGIGQ